MGKVEEMVEEKVGAPERIWVASPVLFNSLISKAGPAFDNDVQYVRADAPNTHQRAERAARRIYDEIDGVPDVPEMADIIAAEFEK